MPNESGDLKLLANFRKLIDLVSADADYRPENATLKLTALDPQHAAGVAAAHDVPAKLATNMTAISDREAAFADVKSLMSRVHALAKASGASAEQLEDLNSFKRKLISKRKPKKAGTAPTDAAATAETEKQRSSAQLSYDNQVGHVRGYLGVLGTLSSYNPNEADLKLTALHGFVDNLQARNDAVSATYVPLSQARGLRDQLLYQADNSVVNTALLAKEYVKAAFGRDSQLYKQIKGFQFKRRT